MADPIELEWYQGSREEAFARYLGEKIMLGAGALNLQVHGVPTIEVAPSLADDTVCVRATVRVRPRP